MSPPLLGALFSPLDWAVTVLTEGRSVWICCCREVNRSDANNRRSASTVTVSGLAPIEMRKGGKWQLGKRKNNFLLTTPTQKVKEGPCQKPLSSFHFNLNQPPFTNVATFPLSFASKIRAVDFSDVSARCLTYGSASEHEWSPTWKLPYRLFLIPAWLLLQFAGRMRCLSRPNWLRQ